MRAAGVAPVSGSQPEGHTVFNIGGNKYRLVASLDYDTQVLLIRGIDSHQDYDNLDL